MALLDGHDGTSLLFDLDRSVIGRSIEKLLGTVVDCTVRVTVSETDYNNSVT